ncbi:hypothetical protein RZS08_10560, partial [Arthrospira platensis SPKY1]|nr:hypothetical protein [Arthrospira platensis SPKY1]
MISDKLDGGDVNMILGGFKNNFQSDANTSGASLPSCTAPSIVTSKLLAEIASCDKLKIVSVPSPTNLSVVNVLK